MHILIKRGGLAALTLLGAAVVGLALLPGEMEVTRSAVIDQSPETLTHRVAHFPSRLDWVAWTAIDPEAKYSFTGDQGAPGATMSWVGEEIGTATLTLLSVDPGREIVARLDYAEPFAMSSTDRVVLHDLGDGKTRVTWTASAPLPYGPSRLFGLVADSVIGPDYAWGLERLQALSEPS